MSGMNALNNRNSSHCHFTYVYMKTKILTYHVNSIQLFIFFIFFVFLSFIPSFSYKCEGATIQLKGKLKSVILDSCKKTNIIFDTAISSCEVVNSKSVQIQATGICPSFAIDKTDGCLVYLSEAAVSVTSFVTSKSTEMNVSWPDERSGEQKEAPIPEQFVHRLMNGSVTSEVSDLYH
jgi:adenylyl cyclase-associated protein